MSRHHARDSGRQPSGEAHEVVGEDVYAGIDDREPVVGIRDRTAVPRKVLHARKRAPGDASQRPRRDVSRHRRRFATEGARGHDGVAWLDVQVGDRRQDPVDAPALALLAP